MERLRSYTQRWNICYRSVPWEALVLGLSLDGETGTSGAAQEAQNMFCLGQLGLNPERPQKRHIWSQDHLPGPPCQGDVELVPDITVGALSLGISRGGEVFEVQSIWTPDISAACGWLFP